MEQRAASQAETNSIHPLMRGRRGWCHARTTLNLGGRCKSKGLIYGAPMSCGLGIGLCQGRLVKSAPDWSVLDAEGTVATGALCSLHDLHVCGWVRLKIGK
jgi:hypothetical protein